MKQWYALYTKPQAEQQVAALFRQRDLETFLPEIEATKGKGRKPFFPRYLFLKVDFEVTGLSQIQWTPGLVRVLAFGGHPLPVQDEIIDLIRRKLDEVEAKGGWPAHNFEPGDAVRITEGPFRDMVAIFDGPATPSQRVQVLLNILGASRVEVDVAILKKVSSEEAQPPAPQKRPRPTPGRGRRIKKAPQQTAYTG